MKMISAVLGVANFFTTLIIVFIGLSVHVFNIVSGYINSTKCPVIVFCREFTKMLLFTKSYKRQCQRHDADAIRKGNAYIDELLIEINDNEEFDPYLMDDHVIGFIGKILSVNVSGEAKLHDGYIRGLRTLHRTVCSLSVDRDILLLAANLGAGVLHFSYSGSVKFMNFGRTVTLNGILSFIEVHIEFTVESKTGNNGKLEKLIIDDMRGIKVWITGLGPLNWAVYPIISGVTKIFPRFVRNFMENRVEKYIAERLPNFQFPIDRSEATEDISEVELEETNSLKSETNTSEEANSLKSDSSPNAEPEEANSQDSEANTTKELKEANSPDPDCSPIEEPKEANSQDSETNTTKELKEANSPKPDCSLIEEANSQDSETNTTKELKEASSPEHDYSLIDEPKEANSQDSETNTTKELEEVNSPEPDSSPIEEPKETTSRELVSSTSVEPQNKSVSESQTSAEMKEDEIDPSESAIGSAENKYPSENIILEPIGELDNKSTLTSEDDMETSDLSECSELD